MDQVENNKVTEITVNTNRFGKYGSVNRKASTVVRKLKNFIQLQFKTKDPVYMSSDLNKKIWERGNKHTVGRIRIRVERGQCQVNPENRCIRLSVVDVNSFKNLKDAAVQDE